MPEPILSVIDITKNYGGLHALKGVSLDVYKGEVLGLVGDNGAGKSTLLKIIAGVQQPTSGTLVLDGEERHFARPIDAVEAGISTVYQDLALAMQRDVVANFFMGRELVLKNPLGRWFGWLDQPAMARQTKEQLSVLHTRIPNVKAECRSLSGGQRQALAIARAASWTRHVLLLDEPTSALGVEQQQEVLALIRRIRDRGMSILLVSHQMAHVMDICDRVVVLRQGLVATTLVGDRITEDNLFGYITGVRTESAVAGGLERAVQ
ncbi:MAG: ATP-binding cassette domain-containing protein [Solirubrobacteraceae bacterium]